MKRIIPATTNSEISPREKRNAQTARKIAGEGIVLLENGGMLPLKCKKIALYGSGARKTVIGGTGSGATHPRYCVGIEEGLRNAGFDICTTGWLDRYDAHYAECYAGWKDGIEKKVEGETNLFAILGVIAHDRFVYPTGIPVEDGDIAADAENAIYVIARQAGEGADRKVKKADYLLDDIEYANLQKVCSAYKNVCVIINVGGFIDLSFLKELNINAVLYMAQAGQEGGNAVADILSGAVSPSGKLTATWAESIYDFPSTAEFSENGDPREQNYKEGIFVGYRYFDTFGIKPKYCFGYGLSYTSFDINASVRADGDTVYADVKVKNTGTASGKEVVQVYVHTPAPAAEYKRLVAFAKTNTLAPGESCKLALQFCLRDLCWYDAARAAYMLARGEYVVMAGNSCADAKAVAVLVNQEERTAERCTNVCPQKTKFKELVPPEVKEDISGLPRIIIDSRAISPVVHNYERQPDMEDGIYKFLSGLTAEELAAIVIGGGASATEGERLVNVMGASGTTTSALYEKYGMPNTIFSDGPAGLNVTPRIVELADGSLKSADTYPQYDFGIFGKMMRARMVARPEDGVCHYQYATTWPAGVLRAQTWNTQLMYEMGDAIGGEMDELGVTCWLAPGINITRNTLCGRTFEYCSEDPVLSGEIAASTINGVQSHGGKGVSLKHFACNNSEFEREYSSSNVGERALREIYLKGFEIAVKKSSPMTLMASYNKINGVYSTNNYDLLTKVLRGEWGFANAVISDWDSVREDRGDLFLTCKAGCDLVMPGNAGQIKSLAAAVESGKVDRGDVMRSAARILKIIENNTVVPFKV